MDGQPSSANDGKESGSTGNTEDIRLLNKLIDDDDDGFKADKSFLDDIARKQAEIIHGYPLASLTGVSDGEWSAYVASMTRC